VSQSTISRELQRNIGLKGYRYKQTQHLSENRRLSKVQAYKMTLRLTRLIDSKLNRKWSPEQISGWLQEGEAASISYESIYQYIWGNKKTGAQFYHHLRKQGKCYQPRSKSQAVEAILEIE
jgi:IS30 family transposase